MLLAFTAFGNFKTEVARRQRPLRRRALQDHGFLVGEFKVRRGRVAGERDGPPPERVHPGQNLRLLHIAQSRALDLDEEFVPVEADVGHQGLVVGSHLSEVEPGRVSFLLILGMSAGEHRT